jgi:predicted metal-binding protein
MGETMSQSQTHADEGMSKLIEYALENGATDAKIISNGDIGVEDRLAGMCRDPECENYGLSKSCPPHVSGPDGFRELLERYDRAVFFKIDVPTEILVSGTEDRREVFQLLHEIGAGMEGSAKEMGYADALAFAGGSCKKIFCHDQPVCRVVKEGGDCRHPDSARASMSGYGVDVSKLMQIAGWKMDRVTGETDPESVPMGSLSGLVLIG